VTSAVPIATLKGKLVSEVTRWLAPVKGRDPYLYIGGREHPYLLRWYVIPRNRYFNVYLHNFLRSDDDRALHDHPWPSVSLVLDGSFLEHEILAGGIRVRKLRKAGDVVFRSARLAHRIEVIDATPAWTLFITGPVLRKWGFHCPNGWVSYQDFLNMEDNGQTVGPGCGDT
jgi:hypothetical protein